MVTGYISSECHFEHADSFSNYCILRLPSSMVAHGEYRCCNLAHCFTKKRTPFQVSLNKAERVGFEPTVTARPQRFSRAPRSTTLAPLRTCCYLMNQTLEYTCYFVWRNCRKKVCIRAADSSSIMPEVTTTR